jgi:hypothetical protein
MSKICQPGFRIEIRQPRLRAYAIKQLEVYRRALWLRARRRKPEFWQRQYREQRFDYPLVRALRLSFDKRTGAGYFLRAESFFNTVAHMDNLDDIPGRVGVFAPKTVSITKSAPCGSASLRRLTAPPCASFPRQL